jgi:chemotaxis methyl-accepting protein methylase
MTPVPDHCEALLPRDAAFERILDTLKAHCGTDFACYRIPTVTRRVLNRMISVGADTFEQYLGLLCSDAAEPQRLLERVTIKVSRFYRNAHTFDLLRREVIPALAASRRGAPLRMWSAGCGCGEEAWTLAMLLEEAAVSGDVLASDLDPAALAVADAGCYRSAALEELPDDLRERFTVQAGERHLVDPALRERVEFVRHDLTTASAAPDVGAGFDLVLCRNVLIYFAPRVQERALSLVRRSIVPGGYLCLGEAEWPMPSIAPSLTSLAHKARVFRATTPATASIAPRGVRA